jgi:hypothetical protein
LLLLLLPDPEVDVVPVVVPAVVVAGDVVVDVVVDAAVAVAVAVAVVFDASTGSWPLANVTVISSQAATNSAAAPPTTRRRSTRVRAARAVFNLDTRSSIPDSLPISAGKRMRIV